jgi:Na+-transporting NADH:ubiquinone oxidoreductase subunit NqrB
VPSLPKAVRGVRLPYPALLSSSTASTSGDGFTGQFCWQKRWQIRDESSETTDRLTGGFSISDPSVESDSAQTNKMIHRQIAAGVVPP